MLQIYGKIDDNILNFLTKSDTIVLESNYDNMMLDYSSYPFYLKRRIKSDTGHLSNNDTANILNNILTNDNTKNVILSHLSLNNNSVNEATNTITTKLLENGIDNFNISFAKESCL
ncbi:MAG: hypothetical protein RSF67_07395 [Clostridia bacterium]